MLVRFLLVTCYLSLASLALDKNIKQIYEWHGIPYGREDPHQQKTAEEAANKFPDQLQNYDLRGIIISDVDLWKNGRVFITIPRHEELPASLLTFSNNLDLTSNNFLWPYPDWTWAKSNDCNAIVNAYGIAIDECDRLWVVDNGHVGGKKLCHPQLLAFNLTNNKVIVQRKIYEDAAQNPVTKKGFLTIPVVETTGEQCLSTKVYIADILGNGIVVYDGENIWRVNLPGLKNLNAFAKIHGDDFYLKNNVLGMALSPVLREPRENFVRYLVLKPFLSDEIILVNTRDLWRSQSQSPVVQKSQHPRMRSDSAGIAFTSNATLLFGLTKESALACWNIKYQLLSNYIDTLGRDPVQYEHISSIKVIPANAENPEQILMVINRYHKILSGQRDFLEMNHRILIGSIEDLLRDSICN